MKMNKLTKALVGLGIVSLASAAHATPVYIYLTGSTAIRSTIFTACTGGKGTGWTFDSTSTLKQFAGTGITVGNGLNNIVYEGNVNIGNTETLVDINCSFTGSEAGIASVAGETTQTPIKQILGGATEVYPGSGTLSGSAGTFSLPGVPPSFLDPTTSYANTNTLATIHTELSGGQTLPDLCMADTSQAVSLTPTSLAALVPIPVGGSRSGGVGIIPFFWAKSPDSNTNSEPDTSYNDLVNVTTPELNQALSGPQVANFFTGNVNDQANVVVIGRNKGSGTHANTLLNSAQYGLYPATVDQFAWDANYNTPGVLAFGKLYTAGQPLYDVGNDGFDSGGTVASEMEVDCHGTGFIAIGYIGISDGINALGHGTGSNALPANAAACVALPFNGVYESDAAVENGNYPFWGQEHIYAAVGTTSTSNAGVVGAALYNGVEAQVALQGTATGAIGPVGNYAAQSVIIPYSAMQVSRGADNGFPVPGSF